LDDLKEQRFNAYVQLLAIRKEEDGSMFHQGEGVYQCIVINYRGSGSIPMKKETSPIVVSVQRAEPYPVKVKKRYKPRFRSTRIEWTHYSSLYGFFSHSKLIPYSNVTIRYISGCIYDGPYLPDLSLNKLGVTETVLRRENHWGKFIFPSGLIYEGPYVDNHFDVGNIRGDFRIIYPNQEVYEGEVLDEKRHGIGQMWYEDGSMYTGEWHCDTKLGYGVFRTEDGTIYEGEFDNDKVHGDGAFKWSDGSIFIGSSFFGERCGLGIYISSHRDIYQGYFDQNLFHKFGRLLYSSGACYEGSFAQGKKHGFGTYTSAEGVKYIGLFNNDKMHGEIVVRKPVSDDLDEI
jgi:hypothetical protein